MSVANRLGQFTIFFDRFVAELVGRAVDLAGAETAAG
jgi:hypothetical protein